MITYLKLGKVRGLTIELATSLGCKPIFQKNSFHYETIIDIPYVQITYTSEQWHPKEKAANGNKENKQIKRSIKCTY